MRKILFRGKKIENGEWVYGDLIQLSEYDSYWYILPNGVSAEMYEKEPYPFRQNDVMCEVALAKVFRETIGEYTGLTNKNGTKIFEGDIIKAPRFNTYPYGVLFENAHFVIRDEWGNRIKTEQWAVNHLEAEIIGNVHDNPELLERGAK